MNDVPTSRGSSRFRNALLALALLVFIYIGGFVAIILDEFVFHTNFFVQHLPDGFREVVRTIYEPLLRLLFSL